MRLRAAGDVLLLSNAAGCIGWEVRLALGLAVAVAVALVAVAVAESGGRGKAFKVRVM